MTRFFFVVGLLQKPECRSQNRCMRIPLEFGDATNQSRLTRQHILNVRAFGCPRRMSGNTRPGPGQLQLTVSAVIASYCKSMGGFSIIPRPSIVPIPRIAVLCYAQIPAECLTSMEML